VKGERSEGAALCKISRPQPLVVVVRESFPSSQPRTDCPPFVAAAAAPCGAFFLLFRPGVAKWGWDSDERDTAVQLLLYKMVLSPFLSSFFPPLSLSLSLSF